MFSNQCHYLRKKSMSDTDPSRGKNVIRQFVAYLKCNGHSSLHIDRWPLREQPDPNEIDAIAGRLAIVHVEIDPVLYPSAAADGLDKVLRRLEDELQYKLDYRLEIRVPRVIPHALTDGSQAHSAWRAWILDSSRLLADGLHAVRRLPGIPFGFTAAKDSASDEPMLLFKRPDPQPDTFARRLYRYLQPHIDKLAPYRSEGYKAILLVDCCDAAMTRRKMMSGLRCAFNCQLPSGVDLLWYINTVNPDQPEFNGFTTAI